MTSVLASEGVKHTHYRSHVRPLTHYGDKLTQPVELSSWKMPPKMMPSLMPASWKPLCTMSSPPSVGFFSTPKWNWPWPLTSFARALVTDLRAALPVEKKTCEVLN